MITEDLWQTLQKTDKKIFLYGMGNGAEKILFVCKTYDIKIEGVFSSEGFSHGKIFCGYEVTTYKDICERYGKENILVLLAFGTSLKDVQDTIKGIANECELYVPDVPVFGDTLFSLDFYNANEQEFMKARELLSDESSKTLFDNLIAFKLTGKIDYLENENGKISSLFDGINTEKMTSYVDAGAYNGDTIKSFLSLAPACKICYAIEPDEKNFIKLQAYATLETRAKVIPLANALWNTEKTLDFDGSGNRNASLLSSTSASLKERIKRKKAVLGAPLDKLVPTADFIKYDVEGAEKEAIEGSQALINACHPTLLVSVYHRSEDLYLLPLYIKQLFPFYHTFTLRRENSLPAWDITLLVEE